MTSKAQKRREALEQWWSRPPWPCVIFSVDPGRQSGFSTIRSDRGGIRLEAVGCVSDIFRGDPGASIRSAIDISILSDLPIVFVLEDWGAGGPMGIKHWVGLGEARGVWRHHITRICVDRLGTLPKFAKVTQSRWRSRVVTETGVLETREDGSTKWRAFSKEEWKEAAWRSARVHFLDSDIPPLDASEAACMGYYAARSDEIMMLLGKRHLSQWGYHFRGPLKDHRLEPLIKATRR